MLGVDALAPRSARTTIREASPSGDNPKA